MRSRNRRLAIGAALTLPIAGLGPLVTIPAAAAGPDEVTTIAAGELSVDVHRDFPQIVEYHYGGATLSGNTGAAVDTILVNDEEQAVEADLTGSTATSADYELTFPDLPAVSMTARISITGEDTVRFEITGVEDDPEHYVRTIEIPGHDLVSVSSEDPGASVAAARMSVDRGASGDSFTQITEGTPAGDVAGSAYVIVNTDEVAAALETNSTYDDPAKRATMDNQRWLRQVTEVDGVKELGVWSGGWTYRSAAQISWGDPADVSLPQVDIVLTGDRNGDDTVDWQDGGIAYRDILIDSVGSEDVPDTVVSHIPFNFASGATHPFLRTLDDVKRINLATDGLGQQALLKGYGSEGHDSAHPDYGGNYNTRAGGLEDLNTLITEGHKWNAQFGVHVNATEVYPEAKHFADVPYDPNAPGWNWIDQSYYLDQRQDIADTSENGALGRFQQLRDEVPGLDYLYIDVFYNWGWQAEYLARGLQEMDFRITSEWSDKFQRYLTWSHWAADENYGGSSNKGINSDIYRFIANQRTDTWNPDPILGNSRIVEFEGWTGQNDWNAFYRNIWQTNLPNKFLQHYPMTHWSKNAIEFTDGVSASATSADDREFKVGDAVVLSGDTYLLPWTFDGEQKLYHYNPSGGTTTWELPADLAGASAATVYELGQFGRVDPVEVAVTDGSISIDAEAGQPYVVYLTGAEDVPAQPAAGYGQGTGLVDPGFNNGDLDAYEVSGDVDVQVSGIGQIEAVFGEGAGSISQPITGLSAGTYSAWAQIEVEPGRTRPTTVSVSGAGVAEPVENHVDRSTLMNRMGSDEKNGTYFQRVRVVFEATGSGEVVLSIAAADGDARVRADDLRVVSFTPPQDAGAPEGTVFFQDFEHQDKGWYPFVKGDAGGINDPRTHLSELNAPFTQKGWNGKVIDDVIEGQWSLKSHGENPGLVYRTVPQNIRFEHGHDYRITFDHQSTNAGAYEWVTGYDSIAGGQVQEVRTSAVPIPERTSTTEYGFDLSVGECGDYWIGLNRLNTGGGSTDFVIDNVRVVDLGESDVAAACSVLETAGAASVVGGAPSTITSTVTSHEAGDASDMLVEATAPEGWSITPAGATSADLLSPGGSLATDWSVTAPKDATPGDYTVTFTATYELDGQARTVTAEHLVTVLEPLPEGAIHISDMEWQNEKNGWGPIERDMANGGQAAGDGPPISLDGQEYPKGVGAHANSSFEVVLNGQCTSFSSIVGVDDSRVKTSSLTFEVWGDDEKLAGTDVMTFRDPAQKLEVDVTDVDVLRLVVTDGGDGNGDDHANWADAQVQCGDDGDDGSAGDGADGDDGSAADGDEGAADDAADGDDGAADDGADGSADDGADGADGSADDAADGTADDAAQGAADAGAQASAADDGTADDGADGSDGAGDGANGTADENGAAAAGASDGSSAAAGSGSGAGGAGAGAGGSGSEGDSATGAPSPGTDPGLPDTGGDAGAVMITIALALLACAAGAAMVGLRRRHVGRPVGR